MRKPVHEFMKFENIKDMLQKTGEKYGQRTAYKFKTEKPHEFKIITHKEAEAININKVYQFTKSKIWEEMIHAHVVQREKSFYINTRDKNKKRGSKWLRQF